MAVNVTWPLLINVIRGRKMNNTFGMVRMYANGSPKPHQGWDLEAKVGTAAYSVGEGKVEFVQQVGEYGKQLCISFDFGGQTFYAFYAHMQSIYVAKGETVSVASYLGTTGKSGNASNLPVSEEHLHFEIRTQAYCGLGLAGRVSPMTIFGLCPVYTPHIG
jgi:murein DD-endopeptidase MepM/ murein hydrolase activator NlpD